jgi:hypothetical protein
MKSNDATPQDKTAKTHLTVVNDGYRIDIQRENGMRFWLRFWLLAIKMGVLANACCE